MVKQRLGLWNMCCLIMEGEGCLAFMKAVLLLVFLCTALVFLPLRENHLQNPEGHVCLHLGLQIGEGN